MRQVGKVTLGAIVVMTASGLIGMVIGGAGRDTASAKGPGGSMSAQATTSKTFNPRYDVIQLAAPNNKPVVVLLDRESGRTWFWDQGTEPGVWRGINPHDPAVAGTGGGAIPPIWKNAAGDVIP